MKKKLLLFIFLVNCVFAFASPVFDQTSYRWRNDDGNQTTATWKATLNTSTFPNALNQPLRLRMAFTEVAGFNGSFNSIFLQYRKNGTGTWTNITTSTANDFYMISSINVTNNTATTQQISSGSFVPGQFKSSTDNTSASIGNQSTEMEYCIARSSNYDITAFYEFKNSNINNNVIAYPTLKAVCSPPNTVDVVYDLNQNTIPLAANGTTLLWYTSATGGTGTTTAPTPSSSTIGTTSYWVTQTVEGCESSRKEIKVIVNNTTGTATSLHFDGVDDYVKVSNFDFNVSNNFTVDFWVKPEKTITLPAQSNSGIAGSTGQSYSLFPTLVGAYGVADATHAGAGISVGTNGICVFEHAGGYLPALLVHPVTISDWTRVTVVYTNKQPRLYINGVLVSTGLISTREYVHPPLRDIGNSDNGNHNTYGPFQGKLDRLYILNNSVIPSVTCEPDPNGDNVIASYFFNQGNAGADNTSVNFLQDNVYKYHGSLINFSLNGTTSNWTNDTPTNTLPTPPTANDQTFCSASTVGNLIPSTSATINWFNQSNGGEVLTNGTPLSTGLYYVNSTDPSGCISVRKQVVVRQSTITNPVVSTPVNYNQGDTATALIAITGGSGLLWYTTATGGTGSATAPIPSTATVGTTPYWVSCTDTFGCESDRVQIVVNVSSTTPATHLDFDGVNDVVDCGTALNTVIDPLNTITVEAWVKPSTNTGLGVIIGNYANSNQTSMQFLLRRDNNNYAFWISGNPGVFKVAIATNAVAINTWQHVAGVWNGSDLKIYVNGILMATTTGVTESSFAATSNTVMIGNNQAGTGAERFTGSIDEIRIWNFARTVEQINGSKNCELQGSQSGLIAYYNFNQGIDAVNNTTVTTLNAVTGPNGTLTNFTLTGSTSNWLAGSPVTTGSIVPSIATVTTPIVYTQGDTATPLTATTGANGTGLLWYTTATGGIGSAIAPTPSTTAVGNTSYWVTSTNANGCESPRTVIVVTVNVINNECLNATNLTVGTSSFNDFPANVSLTGATNSGTPVPTCGNFQGGDVWYTATVPASGNLVIETNGLGAYNSGLEIYTGTCGALSLVSCDDNSGNGDYSKIVLFGQTPGTVIRVRVWENFFSISNAIFQVSAYDYVVPATHLNFDGTNDFVVSASAITNNTENQTYQTWFRIPSIPTNSDTILQRGSDGSGGWSVQVGVNATGNLYAGISATPDTFVTGTTVLNPNTWYQVTFVFENNNSLRLYLDGNLEASVLIGNRVLRNSDNRLRIGSGNIASEFFTGDIDDVRVWNSALSPTDIMNTMNCEALTQTELVAYYKLNQGFDMISNTSETTATDSSGNGNNGTLTNFTLTGSTSNWQAGSIVISGNTCSVLDNSNFEKGKDITIYPNPSNGIFNIVSQENISIEVYNIIGKLVDRKQILTGTNTINISNFESGVYLLKTTNSNGNTILYKLIKN